MFSFISRTLGWLLLAIAVAPTMLSADEPGNRVSGAGSSKGMVTPFEEDERAPVVAPRQPAKPPEGSAFQPKFRSPAIRQVEHTEPVPANPSRGASALSEGPTLMPAPVASHATDARALVDQAFETSKIAETDEQYTQVIELCRNALSGGLAPNFQEYARRLMSWGFNRRGESRAEAGQETEALADFEAAVELHPDSWRAMHNRAVSYAAIGRVREALADFDRTIELFREYPNAYFNRGELRYKNGDFAGAVSDYTLALRVGPPDAAVLNSRGHAFYRMQRFGDALRDYGEAIKLDPENAAAMINRGDVHCDLGQYNEAAKDYRAAVRVAPELGRGYQSAAWLMATCPDANYRNEKLAIDAAIKALDLDGDGDYRYLETLAAAQANAGMFKEAKQSQELAIARAPRGQLVALEKRMSLYQRELAYRERPRTAMTPIEDQEYPVRQASGATRPPNQRPQNVPVTQPPRGPGRQR